MRSRFCTETHKIWLQVKMSVSDAVDVHITLMCYEIRHGTITAAPSIESVKYFSSGISILYINII